MKSIILGTGKFIRDESGATAIEYGLIAALIAVAIIGAVTIAGTQVYNTFCSVANALSAGVCTPK